MRHVITKFDPPPIMLRTYDWCAYHDGETGYHIGWGETEMDAVLDLERLDRERAESEEDQQQRWEWETGMGA